LDAFKIINGDNDTTAVDSEMLKEYLMTMGNKLTEEQADEIVKEFNPKGDKTFEYPEEIRNILSAGGNCNAESSKIISYCQTRVRACIIERALKITGTIIKLFNYSNKEYLKK